MRVPDPVAGRDGRAWLAVIASGLAGVLLGAVVWWLADPGGLAARDPQGAAACEGLAALQPDGDVGQFLADMAAVGEHARRSVTPQIAATVSSMQAGLTREEMEALVGAAPGLLPMLTAPLPNLKDLARVCEAEGYEVPDSLPLLKDQVPA